MRGAHTCPGRRGCKVSPACWAWPGPPACLHPTRLLLLEPQIVPATLTQNRPCAQEASASLTLWGFLFGFFWVGGWFYDSCNGNLVIIKLAMIIFKSY